MEDKKENEIKELVYKAKRGDKEAFTSLILKLEDDLYKIARARLNSEEEILDAVQETMISAYKSVHKIRNEDYFKTWIIKILINKCNDIYKNRKIISMPLNNDIESNTIFDENLTFEFIINQLNYDERIAIILHYLEGYTTKEISKILKTNENTIKSRIFRAKEKIKMQYKGGVQ